MLIHHNGGSGVRFELCLQVLAFTPQLAERLDRHIRSVNCDGVRDTHHLAVTLIDGVA
jgi:hypothetical protein